MIKKCIVSPLDDNEQKKTKSLENDYLFNEISINCFSKFSLILIFLIMSIIFFVYSLIIII